MKLYVFGNELIEEDSQAIKLIPRLKKEFPAIRFCSSDPNENFPPENEKNLIILDTVKGIKKPKIFSLDDLEKINKSPSSPHDYDLGMHLLLLKKLNKIESVKIIGLPFRHDRDEIHKSRNLIKSIKEIISTLLRENERRRTCTGQKHG